jgi:hypothetical protein
MKKFIFALVYLTVITSWAEEAQISGLVAPFNLGTLNPFRMADATDDKNVCIYSSTGYYTVKVTDVYNSSGFAVKPSGKPTAKPIAYQVFWNTTTGTAENFQLLSNQVSSALSGASTTTGCPNGNNANIQIKIPSTEFDGAYAGQYSPSLQIVITPAIAP